MRRDVFVHPMFYLSCDDFDPDSEFFNEVFRRYEQKLIEILEESQCKPLIFFNGDLDPFHNYFLGTDEMIWLKTKLDYGFLENEEIKKFKGINQETSEFRIHGTFYGQCTFYAAMQIISILNGDYYPLGYDFKGWTPEWGYNQPKGVLRRNFNSLCRFLKVGAIGRSQVRYGATLVNPNRRNNSHDVFRRCNNALLDSQSKLFT